MTLVGIAYHYRGTSIHRMRAFAQTVAHYGNHYPVRIVDSPHPTYNRAASRNQAVRVAEQAGWQAVAIHDADMTVPVPAIQEAAEMSVKKQAVVYPYTEYRALDHEGDVFKRTKNSPGGILVCPPHVWWLVGGMNESYTGWGWEDTDMVRRLKAANIPTFRLPHTAIHYHHEQHQPDPHNKHLFKKGTIR